MPSGSIKAMPSSFDSTNYSYQSIVSGYAATNPIGKDSTNTTMSRFNLKTGNGAETWVFYDFDFSSIPANATINSVTAKAKCYINNTTANRIATREVRLYSGTTAKGSAGTVSTSTTAINITAGTWTRDELQKCRLRLYAKRGSNNTTTTYYIGLYGADITVEYTWEYKRHKVTTSAIDCTIEPNGETQAIDGEPLSVYIEADEEPIVKDNGVDVSNQIIHDVGGSGNVECYFKSYTTEGTISGTYYQQAIGKGTSAGSVLSNNRSSKSNTTAVVYYTFDIPTDIPKTAKITHLECRIKGHVESTTQAQSKSDCLLMVGDTPKGQEVRFPSTADTIITIGNDVTWLRSELDNLRLRYTLGYYGGNISGAELVIEYEASDKTYVYIIGSVTSEHDILALIPKAHIKINGVYMAAKKIFRKQSGQWVEIKATDLDRTKTYRLV